MDRDGNFAIIAIAIGIGIVAGTVAAIAIANKNKNRKEDKPSSPQQPTKPSGGTGGLAGVIGLVTAVTGVVGKVVGLAAEAIRKVKEVNAKAYCPEAKAVREIIPGVELFSKFLDNIGIFKDLILALAGGKNINTMKVFTSNITGIGKIFNGILTTYETINDSLFKMIALLIARIKGISSQVKGFFIDMVDQVDIPTIIGMVLEVVIDWATAFLDFLFSIINVFTFFATPVVTVIYEILKLAASTAIKLLLPWMGAFAFIIDFVVDKFFGFIDWLIDLKRELSKFVGWLFKNAWPFVSGLLETVSRVWQTC